MKHLGDMQIASATSNNNHHNNNGNNTNMDLEMFDYKNDNNNHDMSLSLNSSVANRTRRVQERVVLNIYGVGSGGVVNFQPEVVDFGTLLVGNEVSKVIKVVNNSDSTMYFNMESNMPNNVAYKDGTGVLPAFASKRVTVVFTPSVRMYYNVQIMCKLSTASEAAQTGAFGEHTGSLLLWDMEGEQMPQCHVCTLLSLCVWLCVCVCLCLLCVLCMHVSGRCWCVSHTLSERCTL